MLHEGRDLEEFTSYLKVFHDDKYRFKTFADVLEEIIVIKKEIIRREAKGRATEKNKRLLNELISLKDTIAAKHLAIPDYEYHAMMPVCAEAILVMLQSYCREIANTIEPIKAHYSLSVGLSQLYDALSREVLLGELIDELIQQAKNMVLKYDWISLNNILGQMLLCIRPLDVEELLKLIEATGQAASQVRDEDIILLLGKTGVGKSTTTHFLAGSKMARTQVEGITCIAPSEIKNPQLHAVTVSPHMRSETRYVTTVYVSKKDVKARSSQMKNGIVICDTAGFGDTSGAEVNIANGIGLVKLVKRCKSVKPLLLIGKTGTGARYEQLREFTRSLVRFIPDIKEYLDAITYVFTGFSKEEAQNIHHQLKSLRENLNDEEKADDNFVCLIEDLYHKTKEWGDGDALILDPLEDKPGILLDKLMRTAKITIPEKAFHSFVDVESEAKLEAQIRLHERSIENGIKRSEYALVAYKLDGLQRLSELLSDDARLREVYQRCVRLISTYLNGIIEQARQRLDRGLAEGNVLSEEDIEQYKLACAKLESPDLERLIERHLGTDVNLSALCNHFNQVVKHIECAAVLLEPQTLFSIENLQRYTEQINKFKNLSQKFEVLQEIYQHACQNLTNHVQGLFEILRHALRDHQIKLCSQVLSIINQMSTMLAEHLDGSKIQLSRQNIHIVFKENTQEQCNKILSILNEKIDAYVIIQCRNFLSWLEQCILLFKRYDTILEKISQKTLNNFINRLESKFIDTVDKVNDQVKTWINKNHQTKKKLLSRLIFIKSKLPDLVGKLDAINQLSEIKNINELEKSKFYTFSNHLLKYLNGIVEFIEQVFEQIALRKNDKLSYELIYQILDPIKKIVHSFTLQSDLFNKIVEDIRILIHQHIQKLNQSIKARESLIHYYDQANWKITSFILKKLEQLEIFTDFDNTLGDKLKAFTESINQDIAKSLNEIQQLNMLSHEEIDIEQLDHAFSFLSFWHELQSLLHSNNQDQLALIFTELESYSRNYVRTLEQKMEKTFLALENQYCVSMPDIESQQESVLEKNIKIMKKYLLLIKRIEKNHPIFFAYFDSTFIQAWSASVSRLNKHRLVIFVERLSETMRQCTDQPLHVMQARLPFIKKLEQFDNYLPASAEMTFTICYKQFTDIYLQKLNECVAQLKSNLNQYDFHGCALMLTGMPSGLRGEIPELSQLLECAVRDAKRYIRINVMNLSFTRYDKQQLSINKEKEKLQKLAFLFKQIQFLIDEQQVLATYTDAKVQDELKQFLKETYTNINKYIEKALQFIYESIKAGYYANAYYAYQHLHITSTVLELSTFNNDLGAEITDVPQRIATEINSVIRNYETLSVNDYIEAPPKKVMQNLEKIVQVDPSYADAIKNFNKNLMTNIADFITSVNFEVERSEQQKKLRLIKIILDTCPEEIKLRLMSRFDMTDDQEKMWIPTAAIVKKTNHIHRSSKYSPRFFSPAFETNHEVGLLIDYTSQSQEPQQVIRMQNDSVIKQLNRLIEYLMVLKIDDLDTADVATCVVYIKKLSKRLAFFSEKLNELENTVLHKYIQNNNQAAVHVISRIRHLVQASLTETNNMSDYPLLAASRYINQELLELLIKITKDDVYLAAAIEMLKTLGGAQMVSTTHSIESNHQLFDESESTVSEIHEAPKKEHAASYFKTFALGARCILY